MGLKEQYLSCPCEDSEEVSMLSGNLKDAKDQVVEIYPPDSLNPSPAQLQMSQSRYYMNKQAGTS